MSIARRPPFKMTPKSSQLFFVSFIKLVQNHRPIPKPTPSWRRLPTQQNPEKQQQQQPKQQPDASAPGLFKCGLILEHNTE
jgi:hypothetical protein